MAFRPIVRNTLKYPSPEALFNDCKKRKFAGVLAHQADVLRAYQKDALEQRDVAFQMPTGSGKTLVGVLIAEWRRRTFNERPLYLTPTRQLAFQVANEAQEKYDIRVLPLTGKKTTFAPDQLAAWEAGDVIVVTTYNGLFNVNPAFGDPQLIIVDDAHAAENYFAGSWSLSIAKEDSPTLWSGLVALLSKHLRPIEHKRMLEKPRFPDDLAWVDKLPTPGLLDVSEGLTALLDEHLERGSEPWFAWSVLRGHLLACHLYLTATEVLLRPLIAPSSSHAPFEGAKQRIYMSATLGQGGDLERLTGRRTIHRIPIPATWEVQGLGRRLFLFPSRGLIPGQVDELVPRLIEQVPRCVVLAPSTRRADALAELIRSRCGYSTFNAGQIEQSKNRFVAAQRVAAVLANRYDGIDFPGDECRLLIVDGMTRAVNLQERFIMSRMGAAILLSDRMMTRIVQAFGRCTRSATDYSCVVAIGEEVLNLLLKRDKRALLHPELQAEIEFGLEQSNTKEPNDFIDYLRVFIQQDQTQDWHDAGEVPIQSLRADARQSAVEGADELSAGVRSEVDYQDRIWAGDYEGALRAARDVLAALKGPKLGGYRALWNYLAASAAYLATRLDGRQLENVSKDFFWAAARETSGITWLKSLSRYSRPEAVAADQAINDDAIVERLETVVEDIGTASETRLVKLEKEIREGLRQAAKGPFERGHESLGRLLGYKAGNRETPGAPDPWWIVDDTLCLIFEDHSDAKSSALDVSKARQVSSHPNWVRQYLDLAPDARVVPVLVSSVTTADADALPHLNDVLLWPIDEFRGWAERALSAFRQIRNIYPGSPGDLAWRAEARAIMIRERVNLGNLLHSLKDARKALGAP